MNTLHFPRPAGIGQIRLLPLILCFLCMVAEWAEAQSIRRQNYYDFANTGTYDISALGTEIDRTNDGGHIIVGTTHHLNPSNGFAFDLLNFTKLNACGDIEWSRNLDKVGPGPGYSSKGGAIRQTSDGGYIIVGSVTLPPSISTSGWDIFLVKTDPDGNILWERRFEGTTNTDDFGESVQEVYNPQTGSYDGYILTGGINSYSLSGMCNGQTFQNSSLVVIRTDVGGNMLWNQTVSPAFAPNCFPTGDYHHYAYGYDLIQVDPESDGSLSNRFAVVGTFKNAIQFEPSFTCPSCLWPSNNLALVLDISDNVTSGTINWIRNYPILNKGSLSGNTIGTAIQQTATGYAITGTSIFSFTDNDVYFLETDFNGAMLRSFNYDAGAVETGSSIEVTDDAFYISGSASEVFGQPSRDGIVTEIDRGTGLSNWTKRFGGNSYDILNGSVLEYGNRITAIGHTDSYTLTTDYYFLNNVADDPQPACSSCDKDESLSATGIPGSEWTPFFNHNAVLQKENATTPRTASPVKNEECECTICKDVNITFQAGYGEFYELGESIMQTSDDGYILAGHRFGGESELGRNHDMFVVKTDNSGAKQWSNRVFEAGPAAFEEAAYSVRQTPNDNGYILAGDFTYILQGNNSITRDSNAYIVRLDQNGTPLWSQIYGNPLLGSTEYHEVARSIKQTDDNGDGTFGSTDGFVFAGYAGVSVAPSTFVYNAYLVKTTSTGTLGTTGWSNEYDWKQGALNLDEKFYDVIQTDDDNDGRADDGYLAVGYSNSIYTGQPGTLSGYNVFVVKVDRNGNLQWSRIYGTANNDFAFSVQQTDDDHDGRRNDGYIIAGTTVTNGSNNDFYVLKIEEGGDLTWSAKIDQASNDMGRSVIQTEDFSFAVAGDGGMVNRSDQVFLFKISECGSEIFSTHHYPEDPLANQNEDHVSELIQTFDGGLALFGSTCTYSSGTGSPAKGDFYLIKTDCFGDVCLSGLLTKVPTDPNTLAHTITPYLRVLPGADQEEGDPTHLPIGEEYMICPQAPNQIQKQPSPGPGLSYDMEGRVQ